MNTGSLNPFKHPDEKVEEAVRSILERVYKDTKFEEIIGKIKTLDQETIDYFALNMAAKLGDRDIKAIKKDRESQGKDKENKYFHRVKLFAVCLALYDRSTKGSVAKKDLRSQLLRFRTAYYTEKDAEGKDVEKSVIRKRMLRIFSKAKAMLGRDLTTEDVVVKGLTRTSYTFFSSLNRARMYGMNIGSRGS